MFFVNTNNFPFFFIVNSKFAFGRCSALKEIEFEQNSALHVIGQNAFVDCNPLKHFEIPPSIESIGNNAFNQCTSLTTLRIPASISINNIDLSSSTRISII